jgi:NAD(P)-dependent dehydrogenase (short-subunit alcohol dehydrogenase family)
MKLKTKTALITGGNSGIGLATARLFVAEGARVAITGRNQTTLDAAAAKLGPNALAFNSDVLDSKARDILFATIKEKFVTSILFLPMLVSLTWGQLRKRPKRRLTKF